jgi:hypothetical protein
MSGTTTPPAAPGKADASRRLGTVVVSVVAQSTFLLALIAACVIAYRKDDYTLLIAMAGVAATNATSVVNYWIGSSSGSDKKTDLMNAALPPAPPPLAPRPVAPVAPVAPSAPTGAA